MASQYSAAEPDGRHKSSQVLVQAVHNNYNNVLGAEGFTGIDDSGEKTAHIDQNESASRENDLKYGHADSQEKIPSATALGDTYSVQGSSDEGDSSFRLQKRLPNECEVCNERCELVCKGCQKAFYCSKRHQISDWPQHKPDCFPAMFIKNCAGEKILVATKDVPAGGIILKEKPVILLPSTTESADHICLGCYEEVETSVSCSNCKWDICSGRCEKESLHAEYECEVFASNGILPPLAYDAVQLLDAVAVLRILLLRERDGEKRRRLASLSSSGSPEEPYLPLEQINMKVNSQACVKFIREDCRMIHFEKALIEQTYRVLVLNRIRVQDIPSSYMDCRRLSLLFKNFTVPGTSCIPNARWAISGRSNMKYCGSIAAAIDLKKGDEIHCDYMQCLSGTYVRREVIKTVLRRICRCERCKDPTECGTFLMALKCRDNKQCPGDGYLLPENPLDNCTWWKCSKCEDAVDASYVVTVVNRISEELSDVGMDLDDATLKNLDKVIKKHKGHTLHENHYLMLQAEYDYCQRIIHLSQHSALYTVRVSYGEKVLDYANELLQVCENIMPGMHRYKGRLYFLLQRGLLITILGFKSNNNTSRKRVSGALKRFRQKKYAEVIEAQRVALTLLEFEPDDSEEGQMVRVLKQQLQQGAEEGQP